MCRSCIRSNCSTGRPVARRLNRSPNLLSASLRQPEIYWPAGLKRMEKNMAKKRKKAKVKTKKAKRGKRAAPAGRKKSAKKVAKKKKSAGKEGRGRAVPTE